MSLRPPYPPLLSLSLNIPISFLTPVPVSVGYHHLLELLPPLLLPASSFLSPPPLPLLLLLPEDEDPPLFCLAAMAARLVKPSC